MRKERRPRPTTRDETITDRVPRWTDQTNDIPDLKITVDVEALATTEVSGEDVNEGGPYTSAIDAEYT